MNRNGVDKRFFFDISDIVEFAGAYSRVSGIQRVVISVVKDLCSTLGEDRVRCLLPHPAKNCIVECNPAELFVEQDFSTELMLFRLGMRGEKGIFPARARFKAHLRSLGERKVLRAARKVEVMLASVLFPAWLDRYGLQRACDQYANAFHIAMTPFTGLRRDDILIRLGSSWYPTLVDALAQGHRDAGGAVVSMVYDLIPLNGPQYVPKDLSRTFLEWLRRAVKQSTRFLCISEFTATELRQYMSAHNVLLPAVVTPLAHEFPGAERNVSVTALSENSAKISSSQYVLCVGTLEIRKNGALLLRAWLRLLADLGDQIPMLVFAGRRGWLLDEFDALLAVHPQLQRFVKVVSQPSDQELSRLYSGCLFTVFPSLYEGWGLPIGEAAWFGKFCIASNASSMPEVCGDLIDYVDPNDLEDLYHKIRRAIREPDYVRQREARIKQAPLRSWSDVSRNICAQLQSTEASQTSD